ncbi:glutamate receptor 2-like [Lytechinus variegatus]|uniref:glutamate receptor 2-like n=1 Tax=Lytechinus variegatus TaxID=7654 RepID=UPI001BB1679A|nr:glutamate receptor 2-like [Lytechinus variegatus]
MANQARKLHFMMCVLLSLVYVTSAGYQITIFGIFDEDVTEHDPKSVGFRRGMIKYNVQSNSTGSPFQLMGFEVRIPVNNSFILTNLICGALSDNRMLIAGDADVNTIYNAAYASREVKIPYFITSFAPRDVYPDFSAEYLLAMQPQVLQPLVDYIGYFHWSSLAYIYEGQTGFLRLHNFLDLIRPLGIEVTHRRINIDSVNETLNELKDTGKHRIICDANLPLTDTVLRNSIDLEMTTASYHMVYLNLDFDTIDTSNMSFGGMNLTGFSLITNKSSEAYHELFGDWSDKFRYSHPTLANTEVGYEAILAHDLCRVAVAAARSIHESGRQLPLPKVNTFHTCFKHVRDGTDIMTETVSSTVGPELLDAIKRTATDQLSGRVQFDENGSRTNYSLQILGLHNGVLEQVGTWNQKNDPSISFFDSDTHGRKGSHDYENRTFTITSVLDDPFLMNVTLPDGTSRYEGFCVDLLKKIVEIYPFKYRIQLVKDGNYGTQQKNGKWDGMIGELMYGSADISVAPLTINTDRERVVAFTKPYMSFGISIMIKKMKSPRPSGFSFFQPFTNEIWICLALATCGVSMIMFQICRFSSSEWRIETDNSDDVSNGNRVAGAGKGVKWTNDFYILNSLWFALGALMQQGSDILPRSISGRIMGGVWWFFTLIIISSYTANLAAFLTTQSMQSPIKSAEDLAAQTKIQYGVHKGGSTVEFFRKSSHPLYRKMWSFMANTEPSPLAESTEDGVNRVRESDGKYAYLLESKMNEYRETQKPCDTMAVGDPIGTSSYGIAVSKHLVELQKELTVAILELRERDILRRLEEKYWVNRSQCVKDDTDGTDTRALNLDKLAGVFYILLAGTAVALLVSIVDLIYRSKKQIREELGSCGLRRIWLNVRARIAHERLVASLRRRSMPAPTKSPSDGTSETGTDELSTPATAQKSIVPSIASEEGNVNSALCKKKSGSQGSAVTHTDV